MGGCVVQPVSRLEEMNGLRIINPLRPTAPSRRVTGIAGEMFPAPTRCPSQRGCVYCSRPISFQAHACEKGAGEGAEGGAPQAVGPGLVPA